MPRARGFTERDARRIADAVMAFERGSRNPPPGTRGKWPAPGPWGGLHPARTGGSSVAGGTIASPTSFTATLMVPSGSGFTTTGGTSVTAYNPYTGTIAANSLIWVCPFNNQLFVVAANC